MHEMKKCPHDIVVQVWRGDVGTQRLLGALPVSLAGQIGPSRRDDTAGGGKLLVSEAVIEGWQQFSQRQIAGRAENHAIEWFNRNDCCHE
jgi:hypothetical protein